MISTSAISNNANKKLNKVRISYANSSERPFKIKNNLNNHELIREELNVTWPKMARHLQEFIKNLEYDKVENLLKSSRINELTIDIQLYTSPELVARMKRFGVKINFDWYILSLKSLNTKNHSLIELCENVKSNLAQYNRPIPGIDLDGNRLLIEFFKLTKTPYYTIYNWNCSPNIILNDIFEVEPRYRDALMERCLINYNGYIEPLLSTGYTPSIEVLMNCSHCYTIATVVHILECPQLTDDYKIKYLTRILKSGKNYQFNALYHNSTSVKYLKMIGDEELGSISKNVREFIINGTIPPIEYDTDNKLGIINYLSYYDAGKIESWTEEIDIDMIIRSNYEYRALLLIKNLSEEDRDRLYSSMVNRDTCLMYCVNSGLEKCCESRWSRIPTNNENFIQYLEWRRHSYEDCEVELPPAIGADYSLTRLSKSENLEIEVKRLLDELEVNEVSNRYDITLLIVQLMNLRVVNLRQYLDRGYKIVDQLMPYLASMKTKNARRIANNSI